MEIKIHESKLKSNTSIRKSAYVISQRTEILTKLIIINLHTYKFLIFCFLDFRDI